LIHDVSFENRNDLAMLEHVLQIVDGGAQILAGD